METTRKKIAIIDIDGTIADCSHRLLYIGKSDDYHAYHESNKHNEEYVDYRENPDWERFYSLTHLDTPIKENIKIIKRFLRKNNVTPVFVTGRNETTELDTTDFIRKHFLKHNRDFIMFMRGSEDRRSAHEVKKDHLMHILKGYAVVAVFEDDPGCIEMYNNELKHMQRYGAFVCNAKISNHDKKTSV